MLIRARRWRLALLVPCFMGLPGVAAERASVQAALPTLREVAAAYGFSSRQVNRLLRGQRVFGNLEPVSSTELALAAGQLAPRPVDWLLAARAEFDSPFNRADPTRLGAGKLEGDGREGLSELTLSDAELDGLARVEAGSAANFSQAEIASLREAGSLPDPAARRGAVLEAFREVLAGRYASYRERGLAGVAPYQRGGGRFFDPGEQLEQAFGKLRRTRELAPSVHAAMANHPAPPPEGVKTRYSWVVNVAQGKTMVGLKHEVFGVENEHLVYISRRFYVHHTLNSMQTVTVSLPVDEGTAIIYMNRLCTDRVGGVGSSVARRVGRVIMRREIAQILDAYLAATKK